MKNNYKKSKIKYIFIQLIIFLCMLWGCGKVEAESLSDNFIIISESKIHKDTVYTAYDKETLVIYYIEKRDNHIRITPLHDVNGKQIKHRENR